MTHRTVTKRPVLVFALLVVVGYAACGGGSSGGADDSDDEVSDEIETLLPAELRLAIFQALSAEMETLDGGWIDTRSNRGTGWDVVLAELESELANADSGGDIALAFWRLDQAYPNQHSFIKFSSDLGDALPDGQYPRVKFSAEWLSLNEFTFRVSEIESGFSNSQGIEVGDELVQINGVSMGGWMTDYFDYCKKPTQGHCAFDFYQDFFDGLLAGYQPGDDLTYTVDRGGTAVTVSVPLGGSRDSDSSDEPTCGDEAGRYPDGWNLAYEGNRACLYTNDSNPGVALLRIPTFGYGESVGSPITGVDAEVQALFDNWWQANSGAVDHLIIDLIDNGGGDPSYPYFKLLVTENFQAPYAALKKAEIYEDETVREELLLDRGEIGPLLDSGGWDQIAAGEFLDSLPMFCADDNDCGGAFFEPLAHAFAGNVTALTNPACISSCDDVVNLMDDLLGNRARFVGLPNGADSALMRYQLVIYLDDNEADGFRLTREADESIEAPAGALLAQIIAVTRPTLYQSETARTAVPVTLTQFVSFELGDDGTYHRKALEAALEL